MQNHVMNTYGRILANFVSGAGSYLTDSDGKTYFDGLTGIAVCGWDAHPHVAEALAHQAQTLLHTSNLYEIPPANQAGQSPVRTLAWTTCFSAIPVQRRMKSPLS